MMLEKTLENPLDSKEIQPVHPKGNQSWIFIGRIDSETEPPILWPPDVKNWFIDKDPDAGRDWRWEEKGKTEDEMVGWHHQLDGHEFVQVSRVGDGQGSLACCSPWDRHDGVTEWGQIGLDTKILVFLIFNLKPALLPSFILIKRLFIPLRFLPLEWYHPHIWGCGYFSCLSWF